MLRITVQENDHTQTIKLEGKIRGPWVEELERIWISLAPSLGSKHLQLDLRNVSFADRQGQELLREIYQKSHAGFLADTPLTKYFSDQAMQGRNER